MAFMGGEERQRMKATIKKNAPFLFSPQSEQQIGIQSGKDGKTLDLLNYHRVVKLNGWLVERISCKEGIFFIALADGGAEHQPLEVGFRNGFSDCVIIWEDETGKNKRLIPKVKELCITKEELIVQF